MPSRQDRRPSPSEDTAAGTPAPRRWVSVRGGSRKSHRGTPSPRPAPTPAPPRSAPPCRPRWECLKPWSHPSSGSPPPGPDRENTTPTTCGSTAGRGCQPASSRTARSSHRRPQPLRRYSSPLTTQPRSAAWGCRATYPATSAHSCDSFPSVGPTHQPGQPHPLAPPALPGFTATTSRSASVPLNRYSAPHSFCRLEFSLSPPSTGVCSEATPSHVPYERLVRAHAACTPDTTWAVNRYPPGSSQSNRPTLVSMSTKLNFYASTAEISHHLPGPHLTRSCVPFHVPLTTNRR